MMLRDFFRSKRERLSIVLLLMLALAVVLVPPIAARQGQENFLSARLKGEGTDFRWIKIDVICGTGWHDVVVKVYRPDGRVDDVGSGCPGSWNYWEIDPAGTYVVEAAFVKLVPDNPAVVETQQASVYFGGWAPDPCGDGVCGSGEDHNTCPSDCPSPPPAEPAPPAAPGCGPQISFTVNGAASTSIAPGQCATVRWDVECIREVYYKGYPVTGHESFTECPAQTSTYNLHVVHQDGTTSDHYVTVNVAAGAAPPAEPVQPAAPAEPAIVLPTLPGDGQCSVATQSAQRVNMRSQPATSASIVGAMDPERTYTAVAISADNRWYQLSGGGWVAGWVTRHDNECGSLSSTTSAPPAEPPAEPEPEPEPEPAVVKPLAEAAALTAIDLNTVFATCPQFVDYLTALPVYMLLDLAAQDAPCLSAEILLSDLVLSPPPFDGLEGEQFEGIITECPVEAQALDTFLDTLAGVNMGLAQRVKDAVTDKNRCALGRAVIDQVLLPLPYAQASTTANKLLLKRRREFTAADMRTIGAVECLLRQGTSNIVAVANRLDRRNVSPTKLQAMGSDMCKVLFKVELLGEFTHEEQALFDMLVTTCGFPPVDTPGSPRNAMQVLESLIATGADPAAIAAAIQANPDQCNNIFQLIEENTPSPNIAAIGPDVPPALADCPHLARLLKHNLDAAYLYQLIWIFNSPDPCAAAYRFLYEGKSNMPPGYASFRLACTEDWDRLKLADGTILSSSSSWHEIWLHLDRPLDEICSPLDPELQVLHPPLPNERPKVCWTYTRQLRYAGETQTDQAAPLVARAQLISVSPDGARSMESSIVSRSYQPDEEKAFTFSALVFDRTGTGASMTVWEDIPKGLMGNAPILEQAALDQCLTLKMASQDPNTGGIGPAPGGQTPADQAPSAGQTTGAVGETSPSTGAPTTETQTTHPQAQAVNIWTESSQSSLETTEFEGQKVYGFSIPESVEVGIFSGAFTGQPDNSGQSDIYALQGGEIQPLTQNTPQSELFPAPDPTGQLVAYLVVDEQADQIVLNLMRVERRLAMPLLLPSDDLAIGRYPPAWSPDGITILVTLENAAGIPGIYAIDMSNAPRVGQPELLVDNAVAPEYAPNGRYIIYTRSTGDTNTVFTMSMTSRLENAVAAPADGVSCFQPAFAKDAVSLYFVCANDDGQQLYHYGINGLLALEMGIENVQYPAPGPGYGYMAFDDETMIYFANDDGTDVAVMLSLEDKQLSQISWPGYLQ